jgi:transposase-like protein
MNILEGEYMTTRTFNNEAKIKLTQLVNEGVGVLQEIETLNEGLSDTIKAIAEELEIKPSILKKAIRVAHKQRLNETNEENEELNSILSTVGKTS